ncbi:hypothetical protein, partial [Mesorhizobium sp. GbtcB19]|uniref:hypothetical protein n=1 Tax=Mesorhizobium sp. GbtcB19 TaxID=2824764 RepID=UPI001C2F75C9
ERRAASQGERNENRQRYRAWNPIARRRHHPHGAWVRNKRSLRTKEAKDKPRAGARVEDLGACEKTYRLSTALSTSRMPIAPT